MQALYYRFIKQVLHMTSGIPICFQRPFPYGLLVAFWSAVCSIDPRMIVMGLMIIMGPTFVSISSKHVWNYNLFTVVGYRHWRHDTARRSQKYYNHESLVLTPKWLFTCLFSYILSLDVQFECILFLILDPLFDLWACRLLEAILMTWFTTGL